MAEAINYNIKSSFGFNVISPNRTAKEAGKVVEGAIGNLWEPVLQYLENHDDVFSGAVAEKIQKTDLQTLQLGAILNAEDKNNHSFDISG